ncbi:hypothetical protein MKW92_004217, partial [Papaver armeniacum]
EGQLQHSLAYKFKTDTANVASIGATSTGSYENTGLVHLERVISTLRLAFQQRAHWTAGLVIQMLWALHGFSVTL